MKATALEIRLRIPIVLVFLILGFWAPWQSHLDAGPRTAWVWLGVWISTLGTSGDSGTSAISSTVGIVLVTWVAIVFAGVGALLRLWAAAHAAKPQRGLLGAWLLFAAIAILMPPTGALAALTLTALFLFRLALAGDANRPSASAPQWGRAILGELAPIGVFLCLATLSWQYNASLIERAILIACGVALLARAAFPSR
uniref:Uncharacterized protein n=1 Tax=mine drainage metagenome TaxID=410659 RepID=E6PXG0_9ZZZZ